MRNNSNDRLIGVLESTRELLRDVEELRYVQRSMAHLCERVLEVRLGVDREIANLKDGRT